jgi:hypothetical protein
MLDNLAQVHVFATKFATENRDGRVAKDIPCGGKNARTGPDFSP